MALRRRMLAWAGECGARATTLSLGLGHAKNDAVAGGAALSGHLVSGCGPSSSICSRSSSSSSGSGGEGVAVAGDSPALVELRTYRVKPEGLGEYLGHTEGTAPLRQALCPGWIGFWSTETGGDLGELKHLYRYEGGWVAREQARLALQQSPEWTREYLPRIRPLLTAQHSMILVEAQDCLSTIAQAQAALSPQDRAQAPAAGPGMKPVFELRRYELMPGYASVPTLKQHMLRGLASRVAAQKCGDCVFMGHSEVGLLNVFLEIWRYDSTLQCTLARRAARSSVEWQESIAGIATVTSEFRTEYLRATAFSPAQ